jgi:hypothetical protein
MAMSERKALEFWNANGSDDRLGFEAVPHTPFVLDKLGDWDYLPPWRANSGYRGEGSGGSRHIPAPIRVRSDE